MYLVDDVHSLPDGSRRKNSLLPQRTHIVNTVVRRRVKLYDIQHGAVRNTSACGTLTAGIAVHGVLAVDSLCEDAGAGSLTRAAGADENIGVRQPPRSDLIFQRLGNVLLPDDLIEGLRTPLAVKRLIHSAPSL